MFDALAGLLAFFYSLIPSYGVAIILLTLAVGLLTFPLTAKQTRSMAEMARLNPEIQRLRTKHRGDRVKMNEELQALFKEHGVNPAAGCLPLLVQIPIWFVLFYVIRGLTNPGEGGQFDPKYLDHDSELYLALIRAGGKMMSFGIDLAKSASDALDEGFATGLPFLALLAAMVGAQWFQTHRLLSRNPKGAENNPQAQMMQRMQKYMPFFFGLVSFGFPAALVLYWVVSTLFRIAQQEVLFHTDPHRRNQRLSVEENGKAKSPPPPKPKPAPGTKPARNGPPRTSGRAQPKKSKKRR